MMQQDREEIEVFLSDAPVFFQPWWLEAVAPGAWGYAVVRRGSELAAVLPYVRRINPLGRISLRMPQLTQTLGPWLRPSSAKSAKRLAEQKDLLIELIDALPHHHRFDQKFHYSVTNWLPFYWRNFKQTTRYTYVLEPLDDLQEVWRGFASNIRTDIRKAERCLSVVDDLGFDEFLHVHEKTFARQGRRLPYSHALLRRLDAACTAHEARKMFFAVDTQSRIHAAVYLIWTSRSAYYLMGGSDPTLRNSGATSLVLWHAIRFAATVSSAFDFEGSMIEPIERYFRAFGARQTSYSRITRTPAQVLATKMRAVGMKLAHGVGVGA